MLRLLTVVLVACWSQLVLARAPHKQKAPDPLQSRARAPAPSLGGRKPSTAPVIADSAAETTRVSPQVIDRVLSEHGSDVKSCYDRLSVRAKAATGEVTLRFVIDAGHGKNLSVEAPGINTKAFEKCLAPPFRAWQFPSTTNATDVEYPFVFVVRGT